MKQSVAKKTLGSMIALCLFAGIGFMGTTTATAQEQASGTTPPPKVLVIMREFLKPGKGGMAHQKTESAFVQAFTNANSPDHYFAMDSLSGKTRSLFFMGFDSFGDWGKANEAIMQNPTLAEAFDGAMQADGELLRAYDEGAFVFQPDKSVSPAVDIAHMRYMEITTIKVRVGHDEDWDALAKMHDDIYRNVPNAHWAMYKKAFGSESGSVYLALAAIRSLADLDQRRADGKKAWDAVSAGDKKRAEDLEASTLESLETNLFAFNPKISYPQPSWVKADPSFWGQK
jgi:hypothetical protein